MQLEVLSDYSGRYGGRRRTMRSSLHRDFSPAGWDARNAAVVRQGEAKWQVGGVADTDSRRDLDWTGLPVVQTQLQRGAWIK